MTKRASFIPEPTARVMPAPKGKGKKQINPTLKALEGLSMRVWLERADLFGPLFDPPSWHMWRTILIASRGEPLKPVEAAAYAELVGRPYVPGLPLSELWACIGRRGGKSSAISVAALFHALTRDYSKLLRPGERPLIPLVAATREETKSLYQFCLGALQELPALAGLIEGITASTIRLINGVELDIRSANLRSLRGRSVPFAALDELSMFMVEGASPAEDILGSLRPALINLQGQLCCIFSPYSRRGPTWDMFRLHSDGHNPRVLYIKAPTWILNTTIPQAWFDEQRERDPVAFDREFGAEFSADCAAFIDREIVEAQTIPGRRELPPSTSLQYTACVDANAGGSDEFGLAIAHVEGDHIVIDCVRGIRGGRPADAVTEYAALLKTYGVRSVKGDLFSGAWVRDEFMKCGIDYQPLEKNKSELYLDFLPILMQGRMELLDDRVLFNQLINLERRTSRIGKDVIAHPQMKGATDDRANVVAAVASDINDMETNAGALYLKFLCTPEGEARSNQILLNQQLRSGGVIFPTQLHFSGH